MSSINISLKKEAYNFLRSMKENDKSFSDVILSLRDLRERKKGSKESVLKFFGALKESDWAEKEKRMKSFREEMEGRLQ